LHFGSRDGTAEEVAKQYFHKAEISLSGLKPSFIPRDLRRGYKPHPFKAKAKPEFFGNPEAVSFPGARILAEPESEANLHELLRQLLCTNIDAHFINP